MDAKAVSYLTFESIIGALSIVGNALVLIAIYKTPKLQTITNCFIANLAIADLLVGIIVAPLAALSFLSFEMDFYACIFINTVILVLTQVSIFGLVAVAIERFFAIKHPFLYQRVMTVPKAIAVLVVSWLLAVIVGLVPMFGWNLGRTANRTCQFTLVIDMEYMVYFNFLGFVMVPLFIVMIIYVYIFIVVKKQMMKIAALEIAAEGQRRNRKFMREIKAAKSLALVIGLFAACWLPLHICNMLTLFCKSKCQTCSYVFLLGTIVLSHANSVFNPFLYAYGNSQYKSAFRKMFLCNSNSVSDENSINNSHATRDNGDQRHRHATDSTVVKY